MVVVNVDVFILSLFICKYLYFNKKRIEKNKKRQKKPKLKKHQLYFKNDRKNKNINIYFNDFK